MDGLLASPAGGWVTSAPRNMTGSLNMEGLQRQVGVIERADSTEGALKPETSSMHNPDNNVGTT